MRIDHGDRQPARAAVERRRQAREAGADHADVDVDRILEDRIVGHGSCGRGFVIRVARERIGETPGYFDKIHEIVEAEGGSVERFLAVMGPWEYLAIFEYPDLEAAFRVLAKIAKLEVFETETFPAEDVKVFWKELV